MAYPHYFKDVSRYDKIDIYRVLELFEVTDSAIAHAIKKLLCPGKRGTKDRIQDFEEAIASISRFLEMEEEDTPDPENDKFYIPGEDA